MRLRFRRDAGSPAAARRKGTDVGWQTISAIVQSARGRPIATHQFKEQRETIDRVMHEFKHGEIQTSAGRQVKNPKQAIAIGLHEAGASKYESESKEQSRRNLKRTKARERRGATGKRRSERHDDGKTTRAELYAEARRQNLPGRSKMSKRQLQSALR